MITVTSSLHQWLARRPTVQSACRIGHARGSSEYVPKYAFGPDWERDRLTLASTRRSILGKLENHPLRKPDPLGEAICFALKASRRPVVGSSGEVPFAVER